MNHENPKDETIQPSPSIPPNSTPPLPNIDRFSTLPDPILHHIIDLLPSNSAMRTSVLSKRFEAIWLNSSTLDLNESQNLDSVVINDDNTKDVKTPREMFLHRLRRCYERHNLQLLQKLKIHVKQLINQNDLFSVIDLLLIEIAKGNSIEEMDLKFRTLDEPKIFQDPKPEMFYQSFYTITKNHFFSWQGLKSLKLKGCNFDAFETLGSDDIKFPFLKELFISNCLITDALIPNLINWCPELEDLTMQYLLHVETIQFYHLKLNRLTIGCYRSSTKLEINAPSLKEFEFKGTPWLYFMTGGQESQEVRFHPHHVIYAPNLQSLLVKYARVYPLSIRKAMTMLRNIKKVVFQWCYFPKSLRFSGEKLERLMLNNCEFGIGEGRMGFCETRFPNLKFLIFYSCRRLEEFVVDCPTLEMLALNECGDLRHYRLIAPSRQFKFYA